MVAVLFVCLGNICRSPAAEGVLQQKAEEKGLGLRVASCGIGSWHVGDLADERMRQAARERGVNLTSRAEQICHEHFQEFDYILAADQEVLNDLFAIAKALEHKAKIHLMSEFGRRYKGQEVPDPYYGGDGDFQLVLDMLDDCCDGLIEHLETQ